MARFFIERPVFAWVIAILVMLAGILSIRGLPVQQYPEVAPPTVAVSASYPGASAEAVENSVTQVIEQSLTGIDNLRYFSSNSSDGSASVTLTFEPGTDPDIAQVQTQNKVQGAISKLPQPVQAQGVRVTKSNDSFLLVVGFYADNGTVSEKELSDLLVSDFQDPLSRLNGVGNVRVFGSQHAMRIWLDPNKLYSYNMTPMDVQAAIKAQNSDVSAGQLGALPAVKGQNINATVKVQSQLETPEQFKNNILRVNTDGSQVRLGDVARVDIGSEDYERIARYKGMPAAGVAVMLASGANALKTADLVKAKVKDLSTSLPAGVHVIYPYDTTPFIKLSIKSVVETLLEAVVLVFLVMLLFLQNFRATLIPTIAVPVVLLGTFAVLATLGFTINTLTMFAMVLAIGLLVDDAIVVVENVERIMREEGLSPKEATKKSMNQITGALVGIAAVLSTVFIPMAFFDGSAGAIYRQFSVTIVSAMILSVLVALILSPTLCATLLKPIDKEHHEKRKGFLGWFNRMFGRAQGGYVAASGYMARRAFRSFVLYAVLVGGLVFGFKHLPESFLPNEDQGIMFMMISTPPGSSAERTEEAVKKVEHYFLTQQKDNIEHLFTVVGFSFAGSAQNTAFGFVGLKNWDERTRPDQSVQAISMQSMMALSQIKDASVFVFFPPPIRALGNASGFDMQLLDRGGHGHKALMNARNQLLGMAAQDPLLSGVRPNGLDDVPIFRIDVDSEKAAALGLSMADINATLETAWGSDYVNDFVDRGRIKKVYMQADAPYRMMPSNLKEWFVRNKDGQMISFDRFSTMNWEYGSPKLERFNGIASVNIQGAPSEGVSSGAAMDEMQKLVNKLPKGFDLAWSGISYEEQKSGSQALALYAISVLIVFLCLAALYESWAVPFSVILVVPLGVFGAVLGTWLFSLDNDIYFQVALLTTVGLASKNAILIVEFAKELRDKGHHLLEATAMAARQRFRPIIMTSMAFILGVTPLALSHGAGAASQNAIGIAVMGGMLASTLIAIFFVPLFYITVERIFHRAKIEESDVKDAAK